MNHLTDLLDDPSMLHPVGNNDCSHLDNLRGRFVLRVVCRIQGENRSCLMLLRFDPDRNMISGDLFHGEDESAELAKNWMFSWRSEAMYIPARPATGLPWDVAAVCAVTRPARQTRLREKLILTFRCQPDTTTLAAVDFAIVEGEKKKITGQLDHQFDHKRTFRRVLLRAAVDQTLYDTPLYARAMDAAIGRDGDGLSVIDDYDRAGVSVDIHSIETIKAVNNLGGTVEGSLERYLKALDEPVGDPFTFDMFFSGLKDEKDEDTIPQGRVPGLSNPVQIHKNRTVAAIFPREIVTSFARAFEHRTGQPFDLENPADEDVYDLGYRIRFAALHELCHLLNLPHPWQRNLFGKALGQSEPQAKSWTNYGSFYPLGSVMDYHFASKYPSEKARELARSARSDRAFQTSLAPNAGVDFTPREKMQLFHAPFDQIAAGQRAFSDSRRIRLGIKNSPSLSNLLMRIDLNASGDRFDTIHDHKVFQPRHYTHGSAKTMYEPLSGSVVMRAPFETEARNGHQLDFRFGSGRLFLFARRETRDPWAPRGRGRSIEYELKPIQLGGRGKINSRQTAIESDQVNGQIEFRTALPFIKPQWLFDQPGGGHDFTFQVIYLPKMGKPVHSRPLCVSYQTDDRPQPFGDGQDAVAAILKDPKLTDLVQAIRYADDFAQRVAELGMGTLLKQLADPALMTKIADRPDLQWLCHLHLETLDRAPLPALEPVSMATDDA